MWANFLGILPGKLLQLVKSEVTQTEVPMHQLSLVVGGGGKRGALLLGLWRTQIEGEGPLSDGLVGGVSLDGGGEVSSTWEQYHHPCPPRLLISSCLDGGPLWPQTLQVWCTPLETIAQATGELSPSERTGLPLL
jgi:hypothetical protein